jgi:hypothetical protein
MPKGVVSGFFCFDVREASMGVSNKPWSTFSESDYTPEQWYEACLIKPPKAEYTRKRRRSCLFVSLMAR